MNENLTTGPNHDLRSKWSRLRRFLTGQVLCFFIPPKKLRQAVWIAAALMPALSFAQASISTDKQDYHPGDHVVVTGNSWQPNEQVRLIFTEYPVIHGQDTIFVQADAAGHFVNNAYIIQLHDIGQSFTLTATGINSGFIAHAYFTDSSPLDLDQGHNGGIGEAPISPVDWVNGNANAQNSHFLEGQSIPYRFIIKDVTVGTHTVTIGWDIRDGGKSAIDYITHYQRISELVNPIVDFTATAGIANTFPIPAPTATVMVNAYHGNQPEPLYSFNQLPANERLMTCYNAAITSMTYLPEGDPTADHSETRLQIIFTVSGSTQDVLFCWGGHISSRLDWGASNASGDINGSPYHTRVVDFDGNGGSQDRSLKTDAVLFIPSCGVNGPGSVCALSVNSYTAITDGPTPTFTWSVSGASISGSPNNSVVSVIAPSSGSYSVSVKIVDMSGGVASASTACGMSASVTSAPSASAGADQSKCYEGVSTSFTLAGSVSNGTGTWSLIAGSATIANTSDMNSQVSVNGSATIQLTSSSANTNCANANDNVVLTVNPLPTLSCGSSQTLTCSQTSLSLNGGATAGANIHWSGPGIVSGENSLSPVIDQPGTYKMVAQINSTGCSDSCTVNIGQDISGPALSCGSGGTLTCGMTSMTLSATTGTGVSVHWSGPGIVSGENTLNPVINQAGDYKIVATKSSSGCKDSCVVHIGQDISGPALSCGSGGTLTCGMTSMTLSATTGTGVSVHWSGPGIVSGENTLNPVINQAGDYKIVATKSSSGCKDSCIVHIGQDISGPALSCGSGGTLTCNVKSMTLSATSSTGVSVHWNGPGIVSGENTLNPVINQPGDYKIVATKSSSGCKDSCVVVIGSNTILPHCNIQIPDPLPVCGSSNNELTATTENAVTYVWSVSGDGWEITDGQGTASIKYTAGHESEGTFKLVLTGANGCKDSCTVTFGTNPCQRLEPFCSLTQGFYGNANGVACASGERGDVLIHRLLGAPFGNLVLGKPGRSLTITQSADYCLIRRMPASGKSQKLPVGDQFFDSNCNTSIPLNKKGRFDNTLLGQNITLGMNMRLDPDLGSMLISGTSFTTIGALPGPDGRCGTEDDIPNPESVITRSISQSVIDALVNLYGSASVANLFDLANRALGGQSTGGARLDDINDAVSAINEGFDGCRFLQGWNGAQARADGNQPAVSKFEKQNDIQMKAYPNPFMFSTTIEFVPKADGNASVMVYSIDGKKVTSLFSGEVKSDELNKVIFNGEGLRPGIYFYKVIIGNVVYFDKLILAK